MRPQHITAENARHAVCRLAAGGRFNEAAAYHCGKLSTCGMIHTPSRRFNEAAAYHCGKQVTETLALLDVGHASMRPQHITAENPKPRAAAGRTRASFNEAAAYHCGKRGGERRRGQRSAPASMRPQHITAENSHRWRRRRRRMSRFNEAAAYHCGKPASVSPPNGDTEWLQ